MSIKNTVKYDDVIKLGDRELSLSSSSYFIADIAANHDGSLERAKDLIWQAKGAGADCAKFQHFLAKDIVSDIGFRSLGSDGSHQASWEKSVYEVYDQYHCRREWTESLMSACLEAEIDFMTTPYDYDAIDTFADKVLAFKVGSGDISWSDAIERMAKIGKPIFLACGASTMVDVERAVESVLKSNRQLVLMQCNTNYTANIENYKYVNLNVLKTFRRRWPGMVQGLSDHTTGHATVLGAIALGARVIEKHFTDDNTRIGPDHHFAMNPKAWRDMVDRSRELENSLGDGVKRIEENERETLVIQRRSIRARRDVQVGEKLSENDLEMLRPCPLDGIPPYEKSVMIGRTVKQDIKKGEHLTWRILN